MIYEIEDKLPAKRLALFSIQMVLSVFVATVLIANICNVPVGGALVGAGLATIVYELVTNFQSPMFVSNSGAFVAPVIYALGLGGFGAVALGGCVTGLIYCIFGAVFSKISVNNIYKVLPKSLIGAITAVIGLNLMSFIPTYIGTSTGGASWCIAIAFITMFVIAIVSHYAKGIFKILPFLVGTLIGYIISAILTITGICPLIDFSVFKDIPLFCVPNFAFSNLHSCSWSVMIPVMVMYAAYTVSAICECLSDHAALSGIVGRDLYQAPGLNKIFCGEGLANVVGSLLGGLGICSYGESVACIGFSKVASVWVTFTAAIILAALGFLTPVQVFINSIPSCVFAGSAMILYGYISCSGIKMLQQVDLNNQKHLIITSVVLSLGVCGLVIGNSVFSISGTALALIVGIILNFVLSENKE